MVCLPGRRLFVAALLATVSTMLLQLPARASHARDDGYLFDKLTPTTAASKKLLSATLKQDEKNARVLLVQEGFNSDTLNSLKMSFGPPPAPIDNGTVYLQPGYYGGGKKQSAVFVFASVIYIPPPPGGCILEDGVHGRSGGGSSVISLLGNYGQYANSPC